MKEYTLNHIRVMKEYTLNHIRDPIVIFGIFLNQVAGSGKLTLNPKPRSLAIDPFIRPMTSPRNRAQRKPLSFVNP